jgi:hypothetical protein
MQRICPCSVEALQSKSSYAIEARMVEQHRRSAQDTTRNLVVNWWNSVGTDRRS